MNDTAPLTSSDFSELLLPLRPLAGGAIAVGVSGGADSLALTLMLAHWCDCHDVTLTALTVDHGLRPEAADEARQVGQWLASYNIPHEILTWTGEKPESNIQDRARMIRYRLMGEWCQRNAAGQLFLAHHRGDQAETFLMRLFRGSGIDGLSAMRAMANFPISLPGADIMLCRPLLPISKERLTATLKDKAQPWIEDPGNENGSFLRVRVRRLLKDNGIDEGLNEARMAATAQRMGRVRSLLASLTDEVEDTAVTYCAQGYAALDLPPLLSAHEEIALRLLALVIRKISGSRYVPRMTKLEALYGTLRRNDFQGRALGGCLFSPLPGKRMMICRETAAISDVISVVKNNMALIWDGRFRIREVTDAGIVRKIDDAAWRALCRQNPLLKEVKLTPAIRETLPGLFLNDGRIILPDFMAGFEQEGFSAEFIW